eukprot:GEMP01072733.1.p2 GENE.GEMP01072733.1~~GEMP01072733.1.p2  ORF type:complete len:163 (+),score=43.44 GEMP01072733.1:530-1018(+)
MRATGQSMGSLESGSGTTELLASATLKDNPLRVENVRLNECYRMLTSSVRELQRREAVLQAELDELRLIHKHGPKLTEDDRRQIRLLATAQRRLSEAETERDELKAEAAALRVQLAICSDGVTVELIEKALSGSTAAENALVERCTRQKTNSTYTLCSENVN